MHPVYTLDPAAHQDRNMLAERRRYSVRRACEAIKAKISIEDYLRANGVEVRRNRARCLVHGGSNPQSFSIDPEKQLWHCFSCNEGGDLIDLEELVGKHGETWTALIALSTKFGVELPRRPERWHEWQDEKTRRWRMARDALAQAYRRRYFKLLGDFLADIDDREEREQEARKFWEDLWPLARLSADGRLGL